MPAKKKSRKKPAKAKGSVRKPKALPKKKAAKKAPATKAQFAKKKVAKNKVAKNKVTKQKLQKVTTKAKPSAKKSVKKPVKKTRGKRAVTFSMAAPEMRSGVQSGDLQGLSGVAGADSESVNELAEEGNAFEAAAVKGVEDAGAGNVVRTHEVLEDDVPEEYLDKD